MSGAVAIVTYPGSNGDHDAVHALTRDIGVKAELVDYRSTDLDGYDAVVIPGGFSYGDYLRCGAIARFAPVMAPVREFAARGGPVLGICNGFQILTEAHLLPGAMLRNASLQFVCEWTHVRVEQPHTSWTQDLTSGAVLRLPIAHGDGAYFADSSTMAALEDAGQIVFRYCNPDGSDLVGDNPNGSLHNVAGIANEQGNVVGLMPHPERATDAMVGGEDGKQILNNLFHLLQAPV